MYETIVNSATRLLSCDAGGIAIFDETEHLINFPYVLNMDTSLMTIGIRHDSDMFSAVINTGQSRVISEVKDLPGTLQVFADEGVRSLALVPLRVRETVQGVLWAASRTADKTFSNYDMVLLESIGAQASVAIDNVNLFIEQRYISDVLQRGFLPEKTPEVRQTDIGIFYASATEAAVVGGDFYDFIPLGSDMIALALGDSSGKGVEATADAAMAKYTLHSALNIDPDPAVTLTQSNTVAYGQLKDGHFVTLVYGFYNAGNGRLKLGIAGHPYPIHYNARTGQAAFIEGNDPAFGLLKENAFTTREIHLEPNDLIVLYTDGIIELRHNKEFFGAERLAGVVAENAKKSAQDLADAIIANAREFAAGKFTDDIVLLVLKRVEP